MMYLQSLDVESDITYCGEDIFTCFVYEVGLGGV